MILRIARAITRRLRLLAALREISPASRVSPQIVHVEKTLANMEKMGLKIVQDSLDDEQVAKYAARAEYEFYYPQYYSGRDVVRLKKIREHFVAARLLDLQPQDVYLDVASQYSPAPQVYERLFGCKVLRQDLEYEKGLHGRVIGGSAGEMPLESESVTKIAMHCSLEHFEGDEDIALVKEIHRILAQKGRFVVVPLYLSDSAFVITQPLLWAHLPRTEWPLFPHNALVIASRTAANRFERYYDLESFVARIVGNAGMQVHIHTFGDSLTYPPGSLRFAAVFEK